MSLTIASPVVASSIPLEEAILAALAYSDVYDHPLKLAELHKFLGASATHSEIEECLSRMENITCLEGYYYLSHRPEIVTTRKHREAGSRTAFKRALFYGRILGRLPFVRMVALTGSLAMLNLSVHRDMDFMLVAAPGRLWTARAFVLLFGRLARLFGDVLCPNIMISERALIWDARDLYSAREFAQMIPVCGMETFQRLLSVNSWVNDYLPNFQTPLLSEPRAGGRLQAFLEVIFNGILGDRFEVLEMSRKIARFQKQEGYGSETHFSAELCQGNFDHHGAWVMNAYMERLNTFSVGMRREQ